jgi:hypothetical protein
MRSFATSRRPICCFSTLECSTLKLVSKAPHLRLLSALALVGALLLTPVVHGQDAEAVRRAEASFDDGAQAYRDQRYDLAGSHFEAADRAVPSTRALRMAIRARSKTGQGARAATLAAWALRRYPDDGKTTQLCYETISAEEDELHRLDVACSTPCVLAIGTRTVAGDARRKWAIYVEPGELTLSASFDGGGTDKQVLTASAGSHNKLRFQVAAEPGTRQAEVEPAAVVARPSKGDAGGDAMDASEDLGGDDDGSSWIASPAVFVVLAVATAGLGGVTIWSGIDTVSDPGEDGVRQACAGQGTECPAYQDGLAKQLRTNVLIGASAGTALLTGIFAIFVTDWGGEDDVALAPWLGPGTAGLSLGGGF